MDLPELQKQFDEISEQQGRKAKTLSSLAILFTSLISLFKVLFQMLSAQTKTLEQLNNTIESLQQKLGNKVDDSRHSNNENINGRGCKKKKGVNSSDKNRIKITTKEKAATKDVKVVEQEKVIGYDGKEYDKEEPDKLIGTSFIGDDGRKYKYTRRLNSSHKTEFDITLTKTQYFKLEYVSVDDYNNPLPNAISQTVVSAKTDFLKRQKLA